ncbi:hypothetical protein KFE94_00375 [bacterium SCSIO 12643]|nr:hypothetical protein KFE94_00375 [bacterium SCSIO 12643]
MKVGSLIILIFFVANLGMGQKSKLKDDLCQINQDISNDFLSSKFDIKMIDSIDQHIKEGNAIFISKKQIIKLREIQDQMRKIDLMVGEFQFIKSHCDSIKNHVTQEEDGNDSVISIPGKRQLKLLNAEYQLQKELLLFEKGNCAYRMYMYKIELIHEIQTLRSMLMNHKYCRKKELKKENLPIEPRFI